MTDPPTSNPLVERLRLIICVHYSDTMKCLNTRREAADEIERLTAMVGSLSRDVVARASERSMWQNEAERLQREHQDDSMAVRIVCEERDRLQRELGDAARMDFGGELKLREENDRLRALIGHIRRIAIDDGLSGVLELIRDEREIVTGKFQLRPTGVEMIPGSIRPADETDSTP